MIWTSMTCVVTALASEDCADTEAGTANSVDATNVKTVRIRIADMKGKVEPRYSGTAQMSLNIRFLARLAQ